MQKNVAVILAGGNGTRMDTELSKQFYKVAGKAVIEHTVDAFHSHEMIDEISIVVNPAYVRIIEEYLLKNEWPRVKKILHGGKNATFPAFLQLKLMKEKRM